LLRARAYRIEHRGAHPLPNPEWLASEPLARRVVLHAGARFRPNRTLTEEVMP
jgi:hypothetical protein